MGYPIFIIRRNVPTEFHVARLFYYKNKIHKIFNYDISKTYIQNVSCYLNLVLKSVGGKYF